MDIEYKVEFSYEEFRGMLTKIGSFSIRKMRIARLVCIALWAVICLSILLNAFRHLATACSISRSSSISCWLSLEEIAMPEEILKKHPALPQKISEAIRQQTMQLANALEMHDKARADDLTSWLEAV